MQYHCYTISMIKIEGNGSRRATRGDWVEASPALFWKMRKVPWFWEKCPDSSHLWIKYFIQNLILKVSRREKSKISPAGPFFLVRLTKFLSKCPNYTKTPLPWKISGFAPGWEVGSTELYWRNIRKWLQENSRESWKNYQRCD